MDSIIPTTHKDNDNEELSCLCALCDKMANHFFRLSCQNGWLESIEYLDSLEILSETIISCGLSIAIDFEQYAVIDYLINTRNLDLNEVLIVAARNGIPNVCSFLVKKGANPSTAISLIKDVDSINILSNFVV